MHAPPCHADAIATCCSRFSMVAGDGARVVGINIVGLRRRGFAEETIREIKHAFHLLFNSRFIRGFAF